MCFFGFTDIKILSGGFSFSMHCSSCAFKKANVWICAFKNFRWIDYLLWVFFILIERKEKFVFEIGNFNFYCLNHGGFFFKFRTLCCFIIFGTHQGLGEKKVSIHDHEVGGPWLVKKSLFFLLFFSIFLLMFSLFFVGGWSFSNIYTKKYGYFFYFLIN